ncbi:hypothetical protein H0H93_005745 [Arthromyces matolae]|nr:hypothetical protein H0H93_005745 [Arthromyces matolae]
MTYKAAKESWVSDLTGSTVNHVNMISLVAPCSIALYTSLVTRTPPTKSIHFTTAWSILILPLLLSVTLFADFPAGLILPLLVFTGLILLFPRQSIGSPLPSPSSPRTRQTADQMSSPRISPNASITVYRAHMMLMTILGILAVDFPVFPRSLAKCETFGVSLMDLGVGSFVFSQGLVSAIPLLNDPSYLSEPLLPKISIITRKSLPIIFLGIVRVILVKGSSYPEHVSEYGVHWNFFLTLAILPILQVVLHPIIKYLPVALLGILVAATYQLTLSFVGLHDFVLYAPRIGIVSANKEGLVSLAGYLAIHLLGLSAGTIVLPPSPKYFSRALKKNDDARKSQDLRNSLCAPRENDHTAIELFSYTVVWWSLFGALRFFGIGGVNASRRMVNFQYILWVAAFNTSLILGYLLLDICFHPSRSIYSQLSKLKVPPSKLDSSQQPISRAPPLLEAINKNGLVLFLVANVATGVVNLMIPTMYTSDLWAMVILGVYTIVLSLFAWIFRNRRLVRL